MNRMTPEEEALYRQRRAEARENDPAIATCEHAYREAAEASGDPIGFVFTPEGSHFIAQHASLLLRSILAKKKERENR